MLKLEQILLESPNGLTRAEIGRRMRVHRATAARYLDELSEVEPVREMSPGRFGIDPEHYLPRLRVTIHEATALFLAAQLVGDHADRFNPHAPVAIRALGRAFDPIAPLIASNLEAEADRMERHASGRHDERFVHNLETITQAWAEKRIVKILHFSIRRGEHTEYRCGIDSVVPYAAGNTLHVVATVEGEDRRRTFRLDRIRSVRLIEPLRHYEPVETFVKDEEFRDAWGIWTTDCEPVEVELLFDATVARRVSETRWHHSQEIEDLPDGGLIWRGRIAEPREMYPWIRGWGSHVEILKPANLRSEFIDEVRRMMKMYGV
jgi:predicted DNA-binding transcriptional regulator YafY